MMRLAAAMILFMSSCATGRAVELVEFCSSKDVCHQVVILQPPMILICAVADLEEADAISFRRKPPVILSCVAGEEYRP